MDAPQELLLCYLGTDGLFGGVTCPYRRHGKLNLFGALEVATGQVKTAIAQFHAARGILQFMDTSTEGRLVEDLPRPGDAVSRGGEMTFGMARARSTVWTEKTKPLGGEQ